MVKKILALAGRGDFFYNGGDMNMRFELQGVCKAYGDRRVLEDLDMVVPESGVHLLVGPSGCGKSTLVRLLMGLEAADSGRIFYKGRDMRDMNIKAFRRQNQVMFQNSLLSVNPYFKAFKIIAEPLVIAKWQKEKIRERVFELAELVQLKSELLESYPDRLSGGQLQRVVFARALALEPGFLVLDEPFSSLDEIMALKLLDLLLGIKERLGMGILMVTHRPHGFKSVAHTLTRL